MVFKMKLFKSDIVDFTATGRLNEYCFVLANKEVYFKTVKLTIEKINEYEFERGEE